jgi:predicted Zn-dependent peptidase
MTRVVFGDLKNGMRYYAQENRSNHVSGIGIRCGSIYDPQNFSGLAHVVEHLKAKRSSRNTPQSFNLMVLRHCGGYDGDINIRVKRASTFLGHRDLRYRREMDAMFDALAWNVKDNMLKEGDFETERAAIHQEFYLTGIDRMVDLVNDMLHWEMYDKNPARRRVDCQLDHLEHGQLAQVRQFIRRYYVPKNMFVLMFGPSLEDVGEIARRYFEDWGKPTTPILDYDGSDNFPKLNGVKSKEITVPGIGQYHYAIGFPTEPYGSSDDEALDVLAAIWSHMAFDALRECNATFGKGTYRTPADTERTFCNGMISLSFATTDKEYQAEGEQKVIGLCKELREKLVPGDLLSAALEWQRNQHALAFFQYPEILAEKVIDAACNGDPDLTDLHLVNKRLQKLSRRDIRDVANKYFTKGHVRILIKPDRNSNRHGKIYYSGNGKKRL